MLENLLSITGIKPVGFKSNESAALEKTLPSNNSIVKLDILDKTGSNYKLLIDGRLFQSKLPIEIGNGEVLLAKVIAQQPFTLSLDSFVNLQNAASKDISLLLNKLQLQDTEKSQKVIKGFLNGKKPLEKSKLEKLIKIIESEDISIDDIQLACLIQVLDSGNDGYQNLNKSLVQLFSFPIKNVVADIYNSVKSLNSITLPQNIISSLNDSFIIDADELENADGIKLKNYSNQINGFFEFLERIESIDETNPVFIQELSKFQNSFIRYNLQKAYLNRIGISPEFLIVKNNDKLDLIEYELKSALNDKNIDTRHIKLQMNPDQLGPVTLKGFLSGNVFQAVIYAWEKTCTVFAYEKESITEKLQNGLNLKTKISFEAEKPEKNETGFDPQSNTGKINVKI